MGQMKNKESSLIEPIHWHGIQYTLNSFKEFIKNKSLQKNIEEWEIDIYSFIENWLDIEKETFKVQTSGSTGKAKEIVLQRQDMIYSALATGEYFQLMPKDKVLLALPAKYIAGKMMIVRALVLGLDLFTAKPSIDVLKYVENSFTFSALIPLQLQYAIDHALQKEINHFKVLIIGGASLTKKHIETLNDLESNIYSTYGMTETITKA